MNAVHRTISLGKITCRPYVTRRVCPVEIELNIKPEVLIRFENGKQVETHTGKFDFSIMGSIANQCDTDYYIAGQCLDEIKDSNLLPQYRETFESIHRIWKAHHLHYWDTIPEDDQKEIARIFSFDI